MIVAFMFVVVVGAIPATALTRSYALGVPLAVAVVLVTATLGATFGTMFGRGVVPIVLTLMAVANGAALGVIWRRWRLGALHMATLTGSAAAVGPLAWFTGVALAVFALSPPVPLAWDARSIWWFHASWFLAGGNAVRRSIENPLLNWSHPDYPPGDPVSIASLWRVAGGSSDFALAQALTAVMTGLAVSALAMLVLLQRRTVAMGIAATVLIVSTAHLGAGLAAAGYVDVLCAALIVVALTAGLTLTDQRMAVVAMTVALAGAGVVKNEGLVFGTIVVAVAAALRSSGRRWVLIWGGVALAPAIAWQAVVHSINGQSKGDVQPGNLVHLWQVGPRARLWVALARVTRATYVPIGPALLALAMLAIVARHLAGGESRAFAARITPVLGLVAASLLTNVALAVIYAVGSFDLDWWFATSLERVCSTPRLFALTALAVMFGVTLDLWKLRRTAVACHDGSGL